MDMSWLPSLRYMHTFINILFLEQRSKWDSIFDIKIFRLIQMIILTRKTNITYLYIKHIQTSLFNSTYWLYFDRRGYILKQNQLWDNPLSINASDSCIYLLHSEWLYNLLLHSFVGTDNVWKSIYLKFQV